MDAFSAALLYFTGAGGAPMTRHRLRAAILAILAVTMCAVAHAQQPENPPPAAAASPADRERPASGEIPLHGVPKFAAVTPTLYRGSQPSREGFAKLAEFGINIVVDLRGSRDKEREEVTKAGMEYVPIPWLCFHPEDKDFAQFLKLLREHPGSKVFVHCNTGIDRTGMMVAAYRIAEQGWSAGDARKEMDAYGFSRFHRGICPRLADYEEDFPKRWAAGSAFEDLRRAPASEKTAEPAPPAPPDASAPAPAPDKPAPPAPPDAAAPAPAPDKPAPPAPPDAAAPAPAQDKPAPPAPPA
jgi:protein-tyrosine phosphatase